ncbi:MAG: hypothetical protein QMC94_03495 [Anaerosomatales bacterium]|nr:hypothetical protein [Anaerosomatales bacterium]
MKRETPRLDEAVVMSGYTISDRLAGWFFRMIETSNGAWMAEGTDLWGRQVAHRGDDPDSALAACVEDARIVEAHLTSASS